MKKILILSALVAVVMSTNSLAQMPQGNPQYSVHVRNILVLYNNVYVAFQEDICARVYGNWQMRINNLDLAQTKAQLALLINAKNNGNSLHIWWSGGNASPVGVNDLTVVTGICEN